jgi:hypothetical protein
LVAPRHEFLKELCGEKYVLVKERPDELVDRHCDRIFERNSELEWDGATVYRLALEHLGMAQDKEDDLIACPERFRNYCIRTQQQKVVVNALMCSEEFTAKVEAYLQRDTAVAESPMANFVNVLGHCSDMVERTLLPGEDEDDDGKTHQ